VVSDVSELDDAYGRTTARFYDAAYQDNPQTGRDAEFYRALAREGAGPVLELGCGTGRVLLRIAEDGFPCTGLDASRHMLDALRAKSTFPNLRLVHAPMQRFDLGRDRFGLVYAAFRVFQHLYTVEDQLACLECVRRHLAPGGRLAFDVFRPRLERMVQLEEPEHLELRFEHEGETVSRFTTVKRDPAAQLLSVHFRYERSRDGAVLGNEEAHFHMRWFTRFELEHRTRTMIAPKMARPSMRSTGASSSGSSARSRRSGTPAARRIWSAMKRFTRPAPWSRCSTLPSTAEAASSTSRSGGTRISTAPNSASVSTVVTPGANSAWRKSSCTAPKQARTRSSSGGYHSPRRAAAENQAETVSTGGRSA